MPASRRHSISPPTEKVKPTLAHKNFGQGLCHALSGLIPTSPIRPIYLIRPIRRPCKVRVPSVSRPCPVRVKSVSRPCKVRVGCGRSVRAKPFRVFSLLKINPRLWSVVFFAWFGYEDEEFSDDVIDADSLGVCGEAGEDSVAERWQGQCFDICA